ncbi:MAG: pyruvate kinase [Dehalococcoidia bacterium]|nr:pyruvate kinase [Dehalococcoidia bacterium]
MTRTFRRTKIVATVGPATTDSSVLRDLILAGADVLRLNFSHGTHEEKALQIEEARRIAAGLDRPVAILQDLQGPKIRVGPLDVETITLNEGQMITVHGDSRIGNSQEISVSYPRLAEEMHAGDLIFLDDGLIELRVKAVPGVVQAEVVVGGLLSERKGVNLPGVELETPALTSKDETDLRFGLALGVDLIALSFVRRPQDAARAREIIVEAGDGQLLIAKIEKREALAEIDGILESFDGVMVARGDLGVELSHEKVPTAQKSIIRKANAIGKPVITATQMLESMTHNSVPTRAEASDVANAVLDGSDAVMLSGETAIGSYPIETVRTMDKIIREAETEPRPLHSPATSLEANTNAFCSAAATLATHVGAAGLAALTRSGGSARSLSSLRPGIPVFALCGSDQLAHGLNLWRGVIPFVIRSSHGIEDASQTIARELGMKGWLDSGSKVVIVGVSPESQEARTDFIRLVEV